MDVLYHSVVGVLLSKATNSNQLIPTVVYAVLPDLLGTMPYQLLKIQRSSKDSFAEFVKDYIKFTQSDRFFGKVDRIFYRTTHSWLSLIPLMIITRYLFPQDWLLLNIAYYSHLLIDIPTHENDFSQQPFFPFSKWRIEALSWSRHIRIYFSMWFLLFVIFVIIIT